MRCPSRRNRSKSDASRDPPDQADSRRRPLARRALRMARPARVDIRCRNPWLFARRRLFGWNVRFTHASSTRMTRRSARVPLAPSGHQARVGSTPTLRRRRGRDHQAIGTPPWHRLREPHRARATSPLLRPAREGVVASGIPSVEVPVTADRDLAACPQSVDGTVDGARRRRARGAGERSRAAVDVGSPDPASASVRGGLALDVRRRRAPTP